MAQNSSKLRSYLEWALGITLALGVAIGVLIYSQNLDKKYQDDTARSNAYFVIREIPEGTSLADVFSLGFVERREVLKETLSSAAITTPPSGSENSYSQKDISLGQLLLINDFGSLQISTSGLLIPSGKVAISVRLGDVERVAPFLRPGNEVSIFATGPAVKGSGTVTKSIISRTQIIGIGEARFTGGQEYIPTGDVSIITFAINSSEAGKFILASKTLTLHLALLDRDSVVPSDLIRVEDILG